MKNICHTAMDYITTRKSKYYVLLTLICGNQGKKSNRKKLNGLSRFCMLIELSEEN